MQSPIFENNTSFMKSYMKAFMQIITCIPDEKKPSHALIFEFWINQKIDANNRKCDWYICIYADDSMVEVSSLPFAALTL